MKDVRVGEQLWSEWDGEGYREVLDHGLVYYTFEHIDLENDLVRRGLASALQRDGVAYSLSDAYSILEYCVISHCWIGEVEGDQHFTICEEDGETFFGDFVSESFAVTLIEF